MLQLLILLLPVLPSTLGSLRFSPITSPQTSPPPVAAPPPPPQLPNTITELASFDAINICWPFNVAITSCDQLDYGVVALADSGVLQVLDVSSDDGTLTLQTNASFVTNLPVKVVVSF